MTFLQSIRLEYWMARRTMSRLRAVVEALRQTINPTPF